MLHVIFGYKEPMVSTSQNIFLCSVAPDVRHSSHSSFHKLLYASETVRPHAFPNHCKQIPCSMPTYCQHPLDGKDKPGLKIAADANTECQSIDSRSKQKYMKRIKTILLCTLLFGLSEISGAEAQKQFSEQMYTAYVEGNTAAWSEVIHALEQSGVPETANKLELLEYYYGHTAYLISNDRNREARAYISRADKLLDGILAEEPECAQALSLKGVFLGYKMQLSKIKVPILGPRCIKYIRKAYSLEPGNVYVLSNLGHMLYHCPAAFGGNREKGIACLKAAIEKMEQTDRTEKNWFYLNLLVILAQYQTETGAQESAARTYRKIADIAPEFPHTHKISGM